MKKHIFKIIFSIVILVVLFYSYHLYYFQNIYFIGWLSTLISAIFSVLLAMRLAIYIFNYQTNSIQEKTRNKFIPLIEGNLIDISKHLFSSKVIPMKVSFSDGKEFYFYLNIFGSIVIEQAICSNVFNTEQTDILLTIKAAIDFHNDVVRLFINNMHRAYGETPDKYRKIFEFLHKNHENSKKDFIEIIALANRCFKFINLDKEIKKIFKDN